MVPAGPRSEGVPDLGLAHGGERATAGVSVSSGGGVEQVLPAWDGPSLPNVVAAVDPRSAARGAPWAPACLAEAERVVLLVLDGLGWEQLRERPGQAPLMAGAEGGAVTSVAPSTTATALTSLSTGLPPSDHGIVGYRIRVEGGILNVLHWTLQGRDARQVLPPGAYQPHPALVAGGQPAAVVTGLGFSVTGFTAAHLGGAELIEWATASGLPLQVRRALGGGARFVYAYYDGVDRVAHRHGLGELYDAELRAADRLVGDLLEVLPAGVSLAVTADHGQVEVGTRIEVLGREVMEAVEALSGEGRFRWLHARPGAAGAVAEAAAGAYGDVAWVVTAEEMIDEGWLGGPLSSEIRRRLGDVALVPFEPLAFLDPADTGEQRLVGRHGSLTPAEMLVPLLGWPPASR